MVLVNFDEQGFFMYCRLSTIRAMLLQISLYSDHKTQNECNINYAKQNNNTYRYLDSTESNKLKSLSYRIVIVNSWTIPFSILAIILYKRKSVGKDEKKNIYCTYCMYIHVNFNNFNKNRKKHIFITLIKLKNDF
ncbi:hypothetical protein C0J52_23555 [Blattella germanica]|nr:hypothetical protein C0J52_23555 [Blattella germanica]